MKLRTVLAIVFCFVVIPQTGMAGDANFSPIFGAHTFSRNGLYFAGIDGLSAVVANPAALVSLENRGMEFSVIDRAGRQISNFPDRGLHRSFRSNDFSFAGGVYWAFTSKLSAALAYYRAADYQVDWPFAIFREKPGSSLVLVFDYFNDITIDAISPNVAFRLGPLSFGIAANAYRMSQHVAFPQANEQWFSGVGLSAYQFEYKQDAWVFGVNVGVMSKISNKLRIGAMLRSPYKATLEGEATSQMFVDLDSAAMTVSLASDYEMPLTIGLGMAYKYNERVEINLDLAYNAWGSTQDRLAFQFGSAVWETRLTQMDSVTGLQGDNLSLFFNNAIDVGLGLEYVSSKGLAYRAGYRFSQSPNSESTYNMLFPGVDQHWFMAGVGYASEQYKIDFALAYAMGISREINQTENPGAFGEYDSNTLVPMVSLKYIF